VLLKNRFYVAREINFIGDRKLLILKPHGLSVISVKIFDYFAAAQKFFAAHRLGTTALRYFHLLISDVHGISLLILIQLFGLCTVWSWAALPVFLRNIRISLQG
jgi:hypothetical protein